MIQHRSIPLLLFPFLMLGAVSCCVNCKDSQPSRGGLDIQVSERTADSIKVSVYKGREVGEGERVFQGNISGDTSIIVPANKDFSGEAIYKKDGEKAIAVDRDEFEVKDRSDNCDDRDTCFVVNRGELDLSLERDPF